MKVVNFVTINPLRRNTDLVYIKIVSSYIFFSNNAQKKLFYLKKNVQICIPTVDENLSFIFQRFAPPEIPTILSYIYIFYIIFELYNSFHFLL